MTLSTHPRPFLRASLNLAAAIRTMVACLLLTTCATDTGLAPGVDVETVLDLVSLVRAPGDLPIPVDEVTVELRRTSDSSIAFLQSIAIGANQPDTALRLRITVPLNSSPEEFYLKAEARGAGVLYYQVESIVTARRGQSTQTAPLPPVYVGPGAAGDSLEVTPDGATVAAGDSVLVQGTVFEGGTPVPGTPVGFLPGATGIAVRQAGLNQAWLVVPAGAANAQVSLTAVAPNGLLQGFTLITTDGAPTNLRLVAVSAVNQNGTVNQPVTTPPAVRVLDAQDNPVPNVTVTFAISDGGGTLTDSVKVTDGQGNAVLGQWRLGQNAATYVVDASIAGAPSVTFFAEGLPTTTGALVKVSGDAQTANAGVALPQPLVVEVQDSFGNIRATAGAVSWTVSDGTIPATSTVDAQGLAQASWTLGTTQAAPTATATIDGASAIFSATTTFPNPTIQLAFSGIPGVGVGRTSMVRVTLTTPAPAGGTVVTLVSGATNTFTVPASVTVLAGQTVDSVPVTGVAVGTALLTGSAGGYLDGTLSVNVQVRNLNLPVTINVPFGQTASLPISIPSPAPAGGITIAVASSNPTAVGIATPTVSIAAGATSTSATLQGLLPGVSTVTVTNVAYATGTTTATTAASLNFAPTTLSINASFGSTLDLDFVSNNVAVPAPAPGITVTSVVASPTCVAVTPSPATIATGLVSTALTFTYGGSAALPCSSKVVVSAPNIQPDSVTVTVNVQPVINVSNTTVASGLMDNWNGSMGATNHGGTTLTLVSLTPGVAQLAPDATTLAADSIGVSVPVNTNSVAFYLHGMGQTGVATLVARAPGFTTDTFTVTVVAPAFDITGLPAALTTFSPNDLFQVRVGYANAGNTGLATTQLVRFGQPALTATITSGTPATGVLVTSTQTAATTVAVAIPPGAAISGNSIANGGVEFDPLTNGTTTVSAVIPGFTVLPTSSVAVTITAPTITVGNTTVAANLISNQLSGSLSASNHGGTTVSVRSLNPAVMLVSPNSVTAGVDSVGINLLNGASSFTYYVQGTGGQTGTAFLVASAPGFVDDTVTVTVPQASYDISGLTTSTTTLSADDPFTVRVGYGTTAGLNALQVIRPGGIPLVATLFNSAAAVADLVTTALIGDSVQVVIPIGASTSNGSVAGGGVAFDPVAAGATTVTASIAGLLATAGATQNVTVTSSAIAVGDITVGSGLMVADNGTLGGGGQHGGVSVVVKSLNPAVAQVALNSATAAADSISIPLANGVVSFTYVVHGMDGVADSTLIVASAPGFTPDTGRAIVPQAALDISGLLATQNSNAANDAFAVRVGLPGSNNAFLNQVQARRFGGAPLAVTLVNSTTGVADLATLADTADLVSATIAAGTSASGSLANGGVEFDPVAPGTTTVSATIPGYIATTAATQSVTITAPAINMGSGIVGAGLMTAVNGSLATGTHPSDSLTLTSSQPSVLLLSPNTATPGTASIRIGINAGATSFSFLIHGVDGQTGSVAVLGQFPGYTDGTGTGEVRPLAVDVSSLLTSTTALSIDDPFFIRSGYATAGNTGLATSQARRAGAAPLTITVTSSAPAVGPVKTTTDSGGTATVLIAAGQPNSPTTVATGGVAFDAQTAGVTTIQATTPGAVPVNTASAVVTVTTPVITIPTLTVGGGLQVAINGSLNAAVPAGGATVTLTSADPGTVLIAPNTTTAGTGQITIPLAAGATSFAYVVSAPSGVTGTANLTASIPGYTDDVRLITVVAPVLDISSLGAGQAVAAVNDEFLVRVGIPNALNTALQGAQQVRAGGATLTATITNSNATVGQLVTTAGAAQSRTVTIIAGASQSPTTVAAGGVSFDGLVPGSTSVSATIPGVGTLPTSTVAVTVN